MREPQTEQDKAKLAAGRAAVERYVEPGRTIGLGSGSTSHWFVRALGEAVAERGLDVTGVVTSSATRQVAEESGVPLLEIDALEGPLVVTVDGADEIDHDGAMIKGGGACLLWEKIVAHASERMVAVVDPSKVVETLGRFPLPVEVIPFGWTATRRALEGLFAGLGYPAGVEITTRLRDEAPLRTDSGNLILDAHLRQITDKVALADALNDIPGVVEHGLFLHEAREMLIGSPDGSFEVTSFG